MVYPVGLGSQLFPHLLIYHTAGPKPWSPSTTHMTLYPCPQTDEWHLAFCWCMSVPWSRSLNVWGTSSLHFRSRVPVPPSLHRSPRQLCISFLISANLFSSCLGSLIPISDSPFPQAVCLLPSPRGLCLPSPHRHLQASLWRQLQGPTPSWMDHGLEVTQGQSSLRTLGLPG